MCMLTVLLYAGYLKKNNTIVNKICVFFFLKKKKKCIFRFKRCLIKMFAAIVKKRI